MRRFAKRRCHATRNETRQRRHRRTHALKAQERRGASIGDKDRRDAWRHRLRAIRARVSR
ncbi:MULTISPECIES: hypothetical protein [unclassified Lysobacter]|uniref:hypothetical protein n=1 Tax=unclassified Lysobacter TaxID=2635362 RepID=UPI001BE74E32|nr:MULTISPECIES: hypothetical protein [unclassified Lysobacter]MBT2746129.1 hypothetical protein [Lysobacter sp. ISL-42]MBT2752564.1 hypothetical protein [Lysobacter sp. ISL-50]MBT2776707.1 hypothetical protein [Lysobacter sp. ISL-54]MBT2780725.1 hypothetical protein [Lysobacter sp. ISL-52]